MLVCPDPMCASLTPESEEDCVECGKRLRPGALDKGYLVLRLPGHRLASRSGHVRAHRIAAELAAGRALLPGEVVHHKNGNRRDNRPENLEVMTAGEHSRLHARLRRLAREEAA